MFIIHQMKKLQVARFLIFTAALLVSLNAATENSNNDALQLQNPWTDQNYYYTGIISDGSSAANHILVQDRDGQVYLANSGNTFSNGITIQGTTANTAIIGIGYPPAGFTTAVGSSGNSYMGSGRTIRFMQPNGSASVGGILELGCDMSNANCTLRARTTGISLIRGYNQTSSYTIRFSSYENGVEAGGQISVGAGATVIFGFALPFGSSATHYSAFNMSGTSTNSGTLRLFDGISSSTAAINVNAYGVLDCSLCTTQRTNALSSGTLTVAANGKIIFPSTSGTWAKAIA